MNILTNISNFKWNLEWILAHKLDDERLEKLDIGKQYNDEIFVQHPVYTDYYVSQYSRIISLKRDTETLIKQVPLNSEYLSCTLCKNGSRNPMGIHRIVPEEAQEKGCKEAVVTINLGGSGLSSPPY